MAKNYSGRDYKLWVSASSPTNADESASYTLVGLVTDCAVSQTRNAIDKSNKDDGDNSTFVAGRRNITISMSARYDHTANAGQTIFTTAMEAADGTIYFLFTSSNTGDQEFHGSGIVTGLNFDFPDEDVSTVSADVQVSGSLTEVAGT